MRKLILIAGFVLASATAQAGDNRSLSLLGTAIRWRPRHRPRLATTIANRRSCRPQATEAPKADTPKYVERPALVDTKAEQRGH